MEAYKILITPDAEADLEGLFDYIAFSLLAPDTALAYIRVIRDEIAGLKKAPKRYRLLENEPWHSRGIRRMNAKGYAVFYMVVDNEHTVYVQNVIYQKRDLEKVLEDLYLPVGQKPSGSI